MASCFARGKQEQSVTCKAKDLDKVSIDELAGMLGKKFISRLHEYRVDTLFDLEMLSEGRLGKKNGIGQSKLRDIRIALDKYLEDGEREPSSIEASQDADDGDNGGAGEKEKIVLELTPCFEDCWGRDRTADEGFVGVCKLAANGASSKEKALLVSFAKKADKEGLELPLSTNLGERQNAGRNGPSQNC